MQHQMYVCSVMYVCVVVGCVHQYMGQCDVYVCVAVCVYNTQHSIQYTPHSMSPSTHWGTPMHRHTVCHTTHLASHHPRRMGQVGVHMQISTLQYVCYELQATMQYNVY